MRVLEIPICDILNYWCQIPQSPLLMVFLATAFNFFCHNDHAEFSVHSKLVFNLMLVVKCQGAPWHPGLSSFLQHPLAPALQSCWSGESEIASKTSCLFRVIFSLLARCYIKGFTDQDFKMKLVSLSPLWLWWFRSAWTTPAIQRRLKSQQEKLCEGSRIWRGKRQPKERSRSKGIACQSWGCFETAVELDQREKWQKVMHSHLSLCLHFPDRQKDCFFAWGSIKTKAGAATGTWLSQNQRCAKVDPEPSSTAKLQKKPGKMQFSSIFCIHSLWHEVSNWAVALMPCYNQQPIRDLPQTRCLVQDESHSKGS